MFETALVGGSIQNGRRYCPDFLKFAFPTELISRTCLLRCRLQEPQQELSLEPWDQPVDKAAFSKSHSVCGLSGHSQQATSSAFFLLLPLFPLCFGLLLADGLNYLPVCASLLPVAVHWCHLFGCNAFIFCHLCDCFSWYVCILSPKVLAFVRQFKVLFLLAFQHIAIQGDGYYHNEGNITLFFYMLPL